MTKQEYRNLKVGDLIEHAFLFNFVGIIVSVSKSKWRNHTVDIRLKYPYCGSFKTRTIASVDKSVWELVSKV